MHTPPRREIKIQELDLLLDEIRDHERVLKFILALAAEQFRSQRSLNWHAYIVPGDAQQGITLAWVELEGEPAGNAGYIDFQHWLVNSVRNVCDGLRAQAIYAVSECWIGADPYRVSAGALPEQDPERKEAVLVARELAGAVPPVETWVGLIERDKGRPHLKPWIKANKQGGPLSHFLPAHVHRGVRA
jgi:hypothetical protein